MVQGFKVKIPLFESWFCHLLDMWHQTIDLIELHVFLAVHTSCGNKVGNVCECLWHPTAGMEWPKGCPLSFHNQGECLTASHRCVMGLHKGETGFPLKPQKASYFLTQESTKEHSPCLTVAENTVDESWNTDLKQSAFSHDWRQKGTPLLKHYINTAGRI